ncbi:MAG: hypothetical protein Q9173_000252 [Seirophora scorigena]
MSRAGVWIKMTAAFAVFSFGGPALIYYVQPTDEELFKFGKRLLWTKHNAKPLLPKNNKGLQPKYRSEEKRSNNFR